MRIVDVDRGTLLALDGGCSFGTGPTKKVGPFPGLQGQFAFVQNLEYISLGKILGECLNSLSNGFIHDVVCRIAFTLGIGTRARGEHTVN
jgi:hypothetical protein